MKHLILFCDYGLDDALATVRVFLNRHVFHRLDLVPIGGNVPVEVAYRNCFTLLAQFEEVLPKVRVIDTRRLPQPSEYLGTIHGSDGMGDLFAPTVPAAEVTVLAFEEWLGTLSGQEQVISLGPATLVKPLMERHAHPLVMMGGCIHTPPNYNDFEFNHGMDTEAFAYCAPKAQGVITLDTCRVPALDMRNASLTGEDVYTRLLARDVALSYTRGEDGCYVWDEVAVQFVLEPALFTTLTETDPHGNTYAHVHYLKKTL